jgi:hypothetical protein
MTMIIDTLETLELLRERGIHVARTRYVDSAEDAVFFSERQAIELRVIASGSEAPDIVETKLKGDDTIRHAYDRVAPHAKALTTGHVLAQLQVANGTDIAIEGRNDPKLGRIIELRCGAHHVHRLHPLTEDLAESMLSDFHSKRGIAANEKATRMLVHLLERISSVYEDEAIERVLLDPIRLHDNSYHVLNATIASKRSLSLHKRLARDAHDKKSAYSP